MAISVTTFQVLRRTYWWFRCLTCWPSAAGALPHQRGRGFSRKSMVPRPRTGKPIVGARPLQGPVRAARGHRIHLESGSPEPGAPRARRDHSDPSPRGRPPRTPLGRGRGCGRASGNLQRLLERRAAVSCVARPCLAATRKMIQRCAASPSDEIVGGGQSGSGGVGRPPHYIGLVRGRPNDHKSAAAAKRLSGCICWLASPSLARLPVHRHFLL